jgi:hypothetical protein
VLHNIDPLFQELSLYVPELQGFFANFAAATQAHIKNSNVSPKLPATHYLSAMQVLNPESLAVYPIQVGTARNNPYFKPGAFRALLNGGLQVFNASNCSNAVPSVSGPPNATVSQSLIEQLIKFKVANAPETPNQVPATACNQQGPFTINGKTSQFPQYYSTAK